MGKRSRTRNANKRLLAGNDGVRKIERPSEQRDDVIYILFKDYNIQVISGGNPELNECFVSTTVEAMILTMGMLFDEVKIIPNKEMRFAKMFELATPPTQLRNTAQDHRRFLTFVCARQVFNHIEPLVRVKPDGPLVDFKTIAGLLL
jgi:hypothetical protein